MGREESADLAHTQEVGGPWISLRESEAAGFGGSQWTSGRPWSLSPSW